MRPARTVMFAALCVVLSASPAAGAERLDRSAIVVEIADASIADMLKVDELRSLAAIGGSALMNGRTGVEEALAKVRVNVRVNVVRDRRAVCWSRGGDLGISADEAADLVVECLAELDTPTLVLVVSRSPSLTTAREGDKLGSVVAAWVDPNEVVDAEGRLVVPDEEPRALTSDSTRRAGVVADVDPAATVAEWLDLPYD